jgi:transcriptional regulator with XRE-family HTH domain
MTAVKKGIYEFDPNSIKIIRQKLNLSQSDLAQMVGDETTKTTISRWENAKSTPDAKSLAIIYSIAAQGGIMPEFFKKSENRSGRSRLISSWDLQNWSPRYDNLKTTAELIKRTLSEKFPSATYKLFKLFATDSSQNSSLNNNQYFNQYFQQWWATLNPTKNDNLDELGWRVKKYAQNVDEELDAQSYSDCMQDPKDTTFVLISKDGDFAGLIQDLRKEGVSTYLIAMQGSSQKLIESVGEKRLIYLPSTGLNFF